jgi:hypothetical protein
MTDTVHIEQTPAEDKAPLYVPPRARFLEVRGSVSRFFSGEELF